MQIPQHRCTHEELGINATETHQFVDGFFPINPSHKRDLVFNRNKMNCMDHNSWSIYGNYNSEVAQQMWISIDRCVNKTIDESDAEYYT